MTKLTGKASYKNYDAHFVPVVPDQPNQKTFTYYPCSSPQQTAVYHECVVFESAQVLPRYQIELGDEKAPLLKTPSIPSKEIPVASPPIKKAPAFKAPVFSMEIPTTPIKAQDSSLYGPEAWKIWNVEILDSVPPTPQVDLSKKDKILLYIPQNIRVNGKKQTLTLKALKEISGGPFHYFNKSVEAQFGDNTASGWVLIDRDVIPESRGKNYETQKKMVEQKGCSLPSVVEAMALNLIVFAVTGERLYGQEPSTYTRCAEKVDGEYPIVVGGFRSGGLVVYYDHVDGDACGAACALRKF